MAEEKHEQALGELSSEETEETNSYETVSSQYIDDEEDFAVSDLDEVQQEDAPQPHSQKPEPEETVEMPKEKKQHKFLKKIFALVGAVLGAAVAAAGIMLIVLVVNLPKDTICDGIYVNNLNLSGLNYDLAVASIQNSYIYENKEITLESGGKNFSVKCADIEMEAVPEETAKKAMDYGKSGNKLKDAWDALRLKIKGSLVLNPIPKLNTEKLDMKLHEFGVLACGQLTGHHIEYKEGTETPTLIAVPGTSGYDGNPERARQQILEALSQDITDNIHVDFTIGHPHDLTVEELGYTVYKDPVDAEYKLENGQIVTVPEQTGRYIEAAECAALVTQVKEGGPNIEMPYHISTADKTQADLNAKLFHDTLATYTTSFGAGGNRGQNVSIAASKLSGAVIMPGETFSFNKRVGRRSVANGFKTAPEYLNGQTVEGVGGGTCQVSTTLYSAVLYANLEIVSRSNHSMSVSYVPLGQDATVTDGGIDFKFRNNTAYPVKIAAGTNGGRLTVSIIGTQSEPPVKVTLTHTPVSSGEVRVIKTTRTVKNAATGEVIKTENMGRSTYKPHA